MCRARRDEIGVVEPELYKVVRSGIAIIGTQYLAGLGEDEGKRLLKAAEKEFQALPRSARRNPTHPPRLAHCSRVPSRRDSSFQFARR